LLKKYGKHANIYPFALAHKSGKSLFQWVKNAPAYSGIKKRKYEVLNPIIEEITVELRTLDELIPDHIKIDLIKIDVEGGEFEVLMGAEKILRKHKPVVIFEFGMGASDYYGASPNQLFGYLTEVLGYKISTLFSFIRNGNPMDLSEFEYYFESNKEYYFIAHT